MYLPVHFPGRPLARRCLVAVLFAVLGTTLALPASCPAAETYKAGDEVEVFYLNSWFFGKVIDTNKRGEVQVEFKFAVSPQRALFSQANIHFKFESGALARARTWSDTSGKFKIRAAILSVEDGKVKLRKPDLSEIEVPEEKLCDADKVLIKKLLEQVGPIASKVPTPPEVESFAETKTEGGQVGDMPVAYQPDPMPAYKKLKQGGIGFPTEPVLERVGVVLPVGGNDSLIMAAVEYERLGKEKPNTLWWASLSSQKVIGKQLLPPKELVLDYHPRSHRLLTFSSLSTKEDRWGKPALTLWEVVPTDNVIKAIVRWDIDFLGRDKQGNSDNYTPWARVLDGNLILHRLRDHEFVVWNAERKAMAYRTKQESYYVPDAVLSGGGKYLFLPEDKGVRIIETATGQFVATLPVQQGASGVAISEDGRRAAVLDHSRLFVFDLTDLSIAPKQFRAEALDSPFTATLMWVGDDRITAHVRDELKMFSLKHNLVLWRYEFDSGTSPRSQYGGRRIFDIVDSHLVYTAHLSGTSAVGAVKFPGPKVEDVVGGINPEDFMIVKPGSEVRLEVRCGTDSATVQAAVEKQIRANGWKISASAPIVIIAEMRRGEPQSTTYESQSAPSQSVTIAPYISELKIISGNKTIWEAATRRRVPPFLRLQAEQSVQAEIDKWQKPNPGFFDRAAMPMRLLDPAKRDGFGTTMVTTKGLEPRNW